MIILSSAGAFLLLGVDLILHDEESTVEAELVHLTGEDAVGSIDAYALGETAVCDIAYHGSDAGIVHIFLDDEERISVDTGYVIRVCDAL